MLTANPDSTASFSLSDTFGQTWKATTYHRCPAANAGARVWYVESTQGGLDAVTVSQSVLSDAAGGSPLGVTLFEYEGIASVAALDFEDAQCAPATIAAMFTPTITTQSTDLLFAVFADTYGSGVMTAGGGWVLEDGESVWHYLAEDVQNGGAGAAPGRWQATATDATAASTWLAFLVAFRLR
jgi:hypothetical protein